MTRAKYGALVILGAVGFGFSFWSMISYYSAKLPIFAEGFGACAVWWAVGLVVLHDMYGRDTNVNDEEPV